MITKKLSLGLATLLLALMSSNASATVIYNNGSPNLTLGTGANDANSAGAPQSADNFQLLPGANTITDLHWFGGYRFDNATPPTDDFTLRFFRDSSGTPQTTPFLAFAVGNVGRTLIGVNVLGQTIYQYSVSLIPTALETNTTYWLSIMNNSPNIEPFDDWVWQFTSNDGDRFAFRFSSQTDAWTVTQNSIEFAFNLTSDVPEPSTVLLLGSCLAVLGALGRIRRGRRDTA